MSKPPESYSTRRVAFDFNTGAIACYEKAGFRTEGLLRDNRKIGGGYWSSYVMGILEHEWRAAQSARQRG